jgi:hypothetical protein
MNVRRTLIALLPLVTAPFAPVRDARAQVCPSGTICTVGCTTNDAVVQDTTETAYVDCGGHVMGVQLAAGYDLSQGTIHASVGMPLCNPKTYPASAEAHDLFRILGPPPGTPMSFTVELHIHVLLSAGGSGSPETWQGSLTEGSSNTYTQGGSILDGYLIQDYVLPITVTQPAGTPFQLAYQILTTAGQARATASASGMIMFPDLPPGAIAVSCHLYGGATPARPVSWGGLKLRYR